jgi:hypothetical protein
MIGYEMKNGLSFTYSYQAGFLNLLNAGQTPNEMRNNIISFGAGFKF